MTYWQKGNETGPGASVCAPTFFFSSRRRHTRLQGDWSSDVCSSDLELLYRVAKADTLGRNAPWVPRERWFTSEAQEWFIERARALAVEQKPPAPILDRKSVV